MTTNMVKWHSQLPSWEKAKWHSQRPATPPSFSLASPESTDLDAVTWTRATTKSVEDWQGNVHQILSGEVPWQGWRRVHNLFVRTQEFDNAGWVKSSITASANSTTAPDGTETADTITATGSSAYMYQSVSSIAGGTYIFSIYLKRKTGTGTIKLVTFDSGRADLPSAISSTEWTRVYLLGTASTTSARPGLDIATSGDELYCWGAQIERARPGQTTPSEYVSDSVLSTPYHGAKVNGVKYFATDDQGRLIDGTRGYDRDGTGAWVESSSVTPIAQGLLLGGLQTNRIPDSSDLSGWTPGNSPTVAVGYDAQVGVYTRLTLGSGAYVYKSATGFTASARTEAALMARVVAGTGTLSVQNAQAASYGQHDVAPGSVSATRFERIDRFHSGVTVATEFSATSGGNSGVLLIAVGGSVTVDVALVTQVEGERVQSLIYSAGSATTKNADAPSFTALPNYATQNEGTICGHLIPLDNGVLSPAYIAYGNWLYASGSTLYQTDGTTAAEWGAQTERTTLRFATSWETGIGRYGYRDGVSKFAATAYDGAWGSATVAPVGPMLLRELSIYPTALTTAQLQALSS